MPEFYVAFAPKNFFPKIWGGGHVPPLTPFPTPMCMEN